MIDAKNEMIQELMKALVNQEGKIKDRRLLVGYYYTFNFITNIIDSQGQPFRITELEGEFIMALYNAHDLSLNEIALAVDRAPSTIYEYIKKLSGLEHPGAVSPIT